MNSTLRRVLAISLGMTISMLPGCPVSRAQDGPPSQGGVNPAELNEKIEKLTHSLQQTQEELAQSRTEIEQLRATLQEVVKRMETVAATLSPQGAQVAPTPTAPAASQVKPEEAPRAAQISQDDWDLLNARVEEQHQTKVESGSKFRLRLSGLALLNLFGNSGKVDNLDLPSIAVSGFAGAPSGAIGASMRQSLLGLTGIGPEIFGARTSADLQMGFYGGLPSGYTATSSGIANLRLARVRFDWQNTAVVAGLDTPFFSPNAPTTYMSVAVPGFASAGNLWTWTPGVRLEQRLAGPFAAMKVEAGLLDPSANVVYAMNNALRSPSPAESSRIPTYAVRISYNRKSETHTTSFGLGGVSSSQKFYAGYRLTGWAATTDWKFGLAPRTEVSGQFFTGRGIDGFGGVPENPYPIQNPFLYATVTSRLLANVGVIGGWTQLKFRWSARNEFNAAAGTGGRNSDRLRRTLSFGQPGLLIPARNEMIFANYIFRPRSDLLFSAEYRRFRTYEVNGAPDNAGQVGLALGFLF